MKIPLLGARSTLLAVQVIGLGFSIAAFVTQAQTTDSTASAEFGSSLIDAFQESDDISYDVVLSGGPKIYLSGIPMTPYAGSKFTLKWRSSNARSIAIEKILSNSTNVIYSTKNEMDGTLPRPIPISNDGAIYRATATGLLGFSDQDTVVPRPRSPILEADHRVGKVFVYNAAGQLMWHYKHRINLEFAPQIVVKEVSSYWLRKDGKVYAGFNRKEKPTTPPHTSVIVRNPDLYNADHYSPGEREARRNIVDNFRNNYLHVRYEVQGEEDEFTAHFIAYGLTSLGEVKYTGTNGRPQQHTRSEPLNYLILDADPRR